jgi:hypothetical protein
MRIRSCADLILFLDTACRPGGDTGRTLGVAECGLWIIDDGYPAS